jgi:hypothetical protein
MFLKNLAVSGVLVFCSCATSRPVTTVSESVAKPYLTLSDGCEYDSEADTVACAPETFRAALTESAEQTRELLKLRAELDAAEAHANVADWFWRGQFEEEQRKRKVETSRKYTWGAVGVVIGAVTTVLVILSAN